MKTLYLFVLLLAMGTIKTQAHDYQTVYPNRVALFDNSEYIKGLRIDSVKTDKDTILYPFATIQEVSAEGCFSPYKASWIGEKVVLQPDGTNLFFNRESDTITLKTQARVNESWIAFQRTDTFRIEAKVQNIELENVLGLIDSVKTITFRVVDPQGNTIGHPLNSQKVKISKTYGFVETLNFYLFPDIFVRFPADQLKTYKLVGLTNPDAGIQNLNWLDVYDFNVGDELHIQEYNFEPGNFSSHLLEYDNRCIYTCLERTDYNDSIAYRYGRKQSIQTIYKDSTTLVTFDDTVRSVISANPTFDKLPGEPVFDIYSVYSMYMYNDDPRIKIDPGKTENYFFEGDCLSAVTGEGCLYEKRYIDGLGGPYYSCTGYVGESEERKLVYYKKGEIEWGVPLVITGVSNLKSGNQLQVFPNPARYFVTVQLNEAKTYNIQLYNSTGSLVKSEQFQDSFYRLYLTGLKSGIYYYKLTSPDSRPQTGKLLVE